MTGLLAAFVRTCWAASLIPKRILTAGYYLYGWSSERKGRGRLDGDDAGDGDGNGGGAAGDGDGGVAAPCRGCSRSRLASSRI